MPTATVDDALPQYQPEHEYDGYLFLQAAMRIASLPDAEFLEVLPEVVEGSKRVLKRMEALQTAMRKVA